MSININQGEGQIPNIASFFQYLHGHSRALMEIRDVIRDLYMARSNYLKHFTPKLAESFKILLYVLTYVYILQTTTHIPE
jgi:hypothetical protein